MSSVKSQLAFLTSTVALRRYFRIGTAMLALSPVAMLGMACATPSAPEPTPSPDASASQYLSDAVAYAELHSETLGELAAMVVRLSSESATKAKIGQRSLSDLLNVDVTAPADEIIGSLRREISPEDRAALDGDLGILKELLVQVKRDQVNLLQIVPGESLPTAFHVPAMIAVDQESAMLLDLINFYSSPRLMFEDFPEMFNRAEVQLAFAHEAWSDATSALTSLNLAESPTVGRSETADQPPSIDEYLRVELTDMYLNEADGVLLDRMNFRFRYENVSSVDIHSFTGTAAFFDLSDRPIKSLKLTFEVPIRAGEAVVDPDKGYEPNPLRDDDQLLMSSDLQDVKFRFEMKSIVFADGTRIDEVE